MDGDLFKQRVQRLEDSGYLRTYSEMTRLMCAPFWWATWSGSEPEMVRANGTICFVNTGERHIGITANHVYEGYLEAKRTSENLECQFGGNRIDPEKQYIDSNSELDLATFSVPEVFVSASNHYHHNALRWPPTDVAKGEVVLYGGYPQVLRAPKERAVDFGYQYFVSRVSDVSAQDIVIDPRLENLYWPGHEGERINDKWGGHSGGPVYRVIDADPNSRELLDRVELVGIIYEQVFEVFFARPVGLVRADGTIII